ncbi:MAG: glycoside hydrolase family 3 N-terminal domain-containing protein [Niabella sp.]
MKRIYIARFLIAAFVLLSFFANGQGLSTPKYKKSNQPVELRVNDLLKRLSLKEKVYQLATQYPNANVRLGIPNIVAGECLHGIQADSATTFPQAIGLAATWNPLLMEQIGAVIAREGRALGIHQCYAPMLAVVKDARWGRVEESFGEDPYLVSRIGVGFIKGLQGIGAERFGPDKILATAKHFIADGEPIAGLNGAPMDVSMEKLYEVHLPPFLAAIKEAHVGSIMPAHHALNGMPCHASTFLLKDVLRNELGFNGLIVSDNNDIYYLYKNRLIPGANYIASSVEEAALLSLQAGIHQELAIWVPWNGMRAYGQPLIDAVEKGKIPYTLVDSAVAQVLRTKFEMGLFDNGEKIDTLMDLSYSLEKIDQEKVAEKEVEMKTKLRPFGSPKPGYMKILRNPEHNKLALKAAQQSIILLKNDKNTLPLNKAAIKKIAVIGPNADAVRLGGYSTANPRYFVSVLDGIKKSVNKTTEVVYEKGCDLIDKNEVYFEKAIAACAESDAIILAVGGSEETCKENQDRQDLILTGSQNELIEKISQLGKPVIMILLHGRPLAIEKQAQQVDAILDGWYLGQETGNAIAQALFGEINPGGKLPITYPRSVGQVPIYYSKLPWGRNPNYFEAHTEPLYPFGFGLSYTSFNLSTPVLNKTSIAIDDSVEVSVRVKNTGKMAGDEVVQLYLSDVLASLVRPNMELKKFERIYLLPGQEKTVKFYLTQEDCRFRKNGAWVVEPGEFKVLTGSNSTDLKTVSFNVVKD